MIKNFQELVSQIKSQVPIQELIAEHITIKKSGRGYVALCPFHDDHHPSMQIHPQKGIFKCFACGTGGDLITFYALINKKKWAEAIPELANKYGIKVEYSTSTESKTESEIKNQLYELNKIALEFFKNNLFTNDGTDALHYLKNKRKLTSETINKYETGYALNSWDSLFNYLTKEKKYVNELVIASGLFIPRENDNGYYDRFRNRVIFPIFNEANNVIGFGGRTLSSEDVKYINSPETLIFNKGGNLYGLNFAKDSIKKLDYSILTEGYMDVITAHQFGLLNTVATLGTALTQQQARLLTKYTDSKKICLCLDTDNAGKKAVENIFRQINEINQFVNLDIRVTTDLSAKDLDESLNLEGTEGVKTKIENSKTLHEFIFERLSDEYSQAVKSGIEINKKNVVENIIDILVSIKDPIERNEYIKFISRKVNIDEGLINLKLKDKGKSIKQKAFNNRKKIETDEDDEYKMHTNERFKHAEIELLTLYISTFPSSKDMKEELQKIEFIDDKHKLIKDFLDNLSDENTPKEEVVNRLFLEFNEYKHIMSLISDIAWKLESEEYLNDANLQKNKSVLIDQAKEWISWWATNKQKVKEITSKLKDNTNKDEGNELLTQMLELVRYKINPVEGKTEDKK